jgi:hypothetical protein
MEDRISKIAELLREVGRAHHQAFMDVDGHDPDWPDWYAQRLVGRLPGLLETELTQEELASLLVDLNQRQESEGPSAEWADFYARELARRYLEPPAV